MDVKTIVKLDALKALTAKYPEASQDARVSRITEALLLLESVIKPLTPVGAGPIHLRDTISEKVETNGQSVMGILGTPCVYGEPVEMGSGPHFPPIEPIQFWVEKKLGKEGKEAKSIAWAIATIMSRSSRLGVKMFEKGFSENEQAIIRILEMIPADIVKAVN
jgi:hypothetical protein